MKSTEQEVEKLIPFYRLKDFVDHIDKPSARFGEASILLEARSTAIGITVTAEHKRIRIRTTIPPDELDPFHTAWPESMKVKLVKASDPGSNMTSVAPPARENPVLKYGVPVLIAFITAISTAGLLSLHKAVWPDYVVVITSPAASKGSLELGSGEIPFNWSVKSDQPSFHEEKHGVPATITIYGRVGPPETLERTPPTSIHLDPGEYTLDVATLDARPAELQLTVNRTASKQSKR